MATVDDFGDELPSDDKTTSSTGHVEDHNRLSRELAEVQDVVTQIVEAGVGIIGTVGGFEQLPAEGTPNQLYIVGDSGDLFKWLNSTWTYVGNLKGATGNNGAAGTIVGLLGPAEDPPVDAEYGTLWFVADSTPPSPTDAPAYVTGVAGQSETVTTLTLSIPPVLTGDVGILVVNYDPVTSGSVANAPTLPGGWTLIDTQVSNSADHESKIYRRTMQATDNAVALVTPVAAKKSASLMVFRNVDPTPSDVVFGAASNNTLAAPSVTAVTDGIVAGFYMARHNFTVGVDTLSVAQPASFTTGPEALEINGNSCAYITSGYDLAITAGTVAPGNWVRTSSVAAGTSPCAWTVALDPV